MRKASLLCIVITLLSSGISGCLQTVRREYFVPRSTSVETSATPPPKISKSKAKVRFSDTVYTKLKKEIVGDMSGSFQTAMADFDNTEYEKALASFTTITETVEETDTLHQESLFMAAECDIQLGNYEAARKNLQLLSERSDVSPSLMERSFVRLGQVFCALNREAEAQRMFKRLKNDFPQSKFLNLANCDIIRADR